MRIACMILLVMAWGDRNVAIRAVAALSLDESSSGGTVWSGLASNNNNNGNNKVSLPPLALVTGGSRGIGRATCLHLAQVGYAVAVHYGQNQEAAQQVVQQIHQERRQRLRGETSLQDHHDDDNDENTESDAADDQWACAFGADVAQEDQVMQLFQDVKRHFGRPPTALVNNAGVMEAMEKDILKIDLATVQRDLAINTVGSFLCLREFVRHASVAQGGPGGVVVQISSVSAETAGVLAYGMSKAALEVMALSLSKTLPLLHGIRINTVIPGLTRTDMAPAAQIEALKPYIPARRAAEAEEIAAIIAFFLSPVSDYCCGAKIKVSGGL